MSPSTPTGLLLDERGAIYYFGGNSRLYKTNGGSKSLTLTLAFAISRSRKLFRLQGEESFCCFSHGVDTMERTVLY